jgi:hypothetical protein
MDGFARALAMTSHSSSRREAELISLAVRFYGHRYAETNFESKRMSDLIGARKDEEARSFLLASSPCRYR